MTTEFLTTHMLFKVIAGSRAYGLNTPTSDIDYRGIYWEEDEKFITGTASSQHITKEPDAQYFELRRFIELLTKSNPTAIELLFLNKNIFLKHHVLKPLFDIRKQLITRQLIYTFGGYAKSQIKKAASLNKFINNPVLGEKKSIEDFMYFINNKTGNVTSWKIIAKTFTQLKIGLASVTNTNGMFKVYTSDVLSYQGVFKNNQVVVSSIPKGEIVQGFLFFNLNAYQQHIKHYREYHDWIDNRNENRYNANIKNSHNYDGKNMMHCVRLIRTASEALITGDLKVHRDDREFLMKIRNGLVPLEELNQIINDELAVLNSYAYITTIPSAPPNKLLWEVYLKIRKDLKV